MEGIFAIYKPKGPTSHDIINEIRKITGVKRVGHAGTLDPLAEGILIIAIGRENTKNLHLSVKSEKEYICDIKLGETSLTGDEEGPVTTVSERKPSLAEINKTISEFKGNIMQKPHKFSAVKIKGKKAYEIARKGKEPKIEPKMVTINEIEILKYEYPSLSIRVVCGPGVYIRSLTEDIGKKLSTGAYLKSLKRTRVGDFTKEKSLSINEFKNILKK